MRDLQAAAGVLGLRLLPLNAVDESEVAPAFATLVEQHAGALLLSSNAFSAAARAQIVSLAARHAVPTMYSASVMVEAGGFVSYGSDFSESFGLLGNYVARILKGEKPADLPIVQPTKFDFAINLKTAKALGLRIPETLLATAGKVVEQEISQRKTIGPPRAAPGQPETQAARAQQPDRMRRIGVLPGFDESDSEAKGWLSGFTQALSELGWSGGRNLRMDFRWTTGNVDRMRTFAKELVDLQPDVIFAITTPATAALQRETRTIPIVFAVVGDPISAGFVASLPRPGGNLTGFMFEETSMASKWLELLTQIAPGVKRVVLMFNPDVAPGGGSYYLPAFEAAARNVTHNRDTNRQPVKEQQLVPHQPRPSIGVVHREGERTPILIEQIEAPKVPSKK
jgi:ABC-type uncharacterized transport system substrate-binding protein